jgi:hypothetical protein
LLCTATNVTRTLAAYDDLLANLAAQHEHGLPSLGGSNFSQALSVTPSVDLSTDCTLNSVCRTINGSADARVRVFRHQFAGRDQPDHNPAAFVRPAARPVKLRQVNGHQGEPRTKSGQGKLKAPFNRGPCLFREFHVRAPDVQSHRRSPIACSLFSTLPGRMLPRTQHLDKSKFIT